MSRLHLRENSLTTAAILFAAGITVPILLTARLGIAADPSQTESNIAKRGQEDVVRTIRKLGGRVQRDAEGEVISVHFQGNALDCDLQRLNAFGGLRALNLASTLIGDEGLAHLADIDTLEDLNLSDCPRVTDVGLRHVSKLRNLTSLTVSKASITDKGLEELVVLKNLRRLDLTGLPITDFGALHLVELKNLRLLFFCRLGDGATQPSLVSHDVAEILREALPNCEIIHETGDPIAARLKVQIDAAEARARREQVRRRIERGFTVTNIEEAIAALKALPAAIGKDGEERPRGVVQPGSVNGNERISIVDLGEYQAGDRIVFVDLDGYQLNDDFVAHLSFLKDLRVLDLSRNPISDRGIEHLAGLSHLNVLKIDSTYVTDQGLSNLSQLRDLQKLGLGGLPITDSGLQHLTNLRSLSELFLADTRITDRGLQHLSSLNNLKRLYLMRTEVSDEGLRYLEGLKKLERLDVSGSRVSEKGIEALAESLPHCEVELWRNARRP